MNNCDCPEDQIGCGCSSELSAYCVIYQGSNLEELAINKGDRLEDILVKIKDYNTNILQKVISLTTFLPLGEGVEIFSGDMTDNITEYKTFASSPTVLVASDANTISFSVNPANIQGLVTAVPSATDQFYFWNGSNFIWRDLTDILGQNSVTSLNNVGVGQTLIKSFDGGNNSYDIYSVTTASNKISFSIVNDTLQFALNTQNIAINDLKDIPVPSGANPKKLIWDGGIFSWEDEASGVGEVNTASNVGATGLGLFAGKDNLDLQFKKITNGAHTTLVEAANVITIGVDLSNANIDDFTSVPTAPSDGNDYILQFVDGVYSWVLKPEPIPDTFNRTLTQASEPDNTVWNATFGRDLRAGDIWITT